MKNTKWCWLATEVRGGWRLKLCIGNTIEFRPTKTKIFKTVKAVEDFANILFNANGKIVFIHLKNTKYPVK